MRTAAEDQVPADRAVSGDLYPTAAQKQILQIEKAYPGQGICLADVIVYAPFRGRGHGRMGLELLCEQARKDGFGAIYDDIALDNPARGLFLSLGFTEESRTEEILLLKKDLR